MTTSADKGAIAEVGSPVRIASDPVDAVRPWRWMTTGIATATAVLLVLNAHAIGDWLGELSPNRITQLLRPPIDALVGATTAAGLDAPRAGLHARWTQVRSVRFGTEQPGEQGAAAATD